jgi:hypothetical protein
LLFSDWSLVFGLRSLDLARAIRINREDHQLSKKAKTKSQKPKTRTLMSTRHQQTNLFNRRYFRINIANDAALVNNQQPIGKRRHFFQLCRDE